MAVRVFRPDSSGGCQLISRADLAIGGRPRARRGCSRAGPCRRACDGAAARRRAPASGHRPPGPGSNRSSRASWGTWLARRAGCHVVKSMNFTWCTCRRHARLSRVSPLAIDDQRRCRGCAAGTVSRALAARSSRNRGGIFNEVASGVRSRPSERWAICQLSPHLLCSAAGGIPIDDRVDAALPLRPGTGLEAGSAHARRSSDS